MAFECIGKRLDRELTRRAGRVAPGVAVYRCRVILFKGRDVSKIIRGMYRPALNEIWLGPYATEDTFRHELAHAKLCRENPELCREAERDIDLAIRIERMADRIAKELPGT